MLNFCLLACGVFAFVRFYIRQYETQGKTLISAVIAISLTALLNIIQFIFDKLIGFFL